MVDDLAGENAPVTLSVARLNSVQFPIPAGTNQFSGPREIPCNVNGVFVGPFLPQVQIPVDHPRGEIILGGQLLFCPHYQHTRPGVITLSTEFGHLF